MNELEIGKLSLAPGDVLVIRTDRVISREAAERLKESAAPLLPPGVKCLVIEAGMELSVLTRAEIEARAE